MNQSTTTSSDAIDRRPLLQPAVVFRVLDDLSCVVVDPASGEAHALNAVGTAVLERCDGTLSAIEIAAEIGDLFDVPNSDHVTSDVVTFLANLRDRGLIVW